MPLDDDVDGAARAPAPMYTPSQMRMLKIAVIAMGVVLLLGFATVIGRIVWLVNSAPRPVAGAAPMPAAVGAALPEALPPLALPKGAVVRHVSLAGNRIVVHFEAPSGAGIRIVDLGSGRSTTLPIVEEPAR